MNFVSNIPYIFPLFVALIITIVSISQEENFQAISVKTSIAIVVFYLVGLIIQKLVIQIIMDAREHKKLIEQEIQKREKETNSKKQTEQFSQDDEFSPMDYKHANIDEVKNN